jgi:hypothetical protein
MSWKKWIGLVVVLALSFGAYRVWLLINALSLPISEEEIAAIREIVDRQNEGAFYRPTRKSLKPQATNPLKNVYFGDLHVHTNVSSDAYLFGNRLDMDAAYRIAKGESVKTRTGERMALTRPLDFAALTDHAEGFGHRIACDSADIIDAGREQCEEMEAPSIIGFLKMRSRAQQRPMVRYVSIFNDDPLVERNYAAQTWQKVQDVADRHYEPGAFTTFAAYEYSPVLPDRGKHHRNIVSGQWTCRNTRCQDLMRRPNLICGRILRQTVRMTANF